MSTWQRGWLRGRSLQPGAAQPGDPQPDDPQPDERQAGERQAGDRQAGERQAGHPAPTGTALAEPEPLEPKVPFTAAEVSTDGGGPMANHHEQEHR